MKIMLSLALVLLGASSANAFNKITCTTDTNVIDYVEVYQDGGEETLAVHLPSEKTERYLIMENDYQGRIVAVKDTDFNGRKANSRGVILLINQKTTKANLAYDGQVIAMECK
ncbi:hypothetical protein D3C87_1136820 [compost metagenome]